MEVLEGAYRGAPTFQAVYVMSHFEEPTWTPGNRRSQTTLAVVEDDLDESGLSLDIS